MNSFIAKTMANPQFSGFHLMQQTVVFPLAFNQTRDFYVPLKAYRKYIFFASGDHDTTDIDIYLYSPQGTQVAYDTNNAADAGVTHMASQNGTYKARVKLYNCKNCPGNTLKALSFNWGEY